MSPAAAVSGPTSSAGPAGDHDVTPLLVLGGVALLSMASRRALLRR